VTGVVCLAGRRRCGDPDVASHGAIQSARFNQMAVVESLTVPHEEASRRVAMEE
jgi:hypothetical protein